MLRRKEILLYEEIPSYEDLMKLIQYDGYSIIGVEIVDYANFQFPSQIFQFAIELSEKKATINDVRVGIENIKLNNVKIKTS